MNEEVINHYNCLVDENNDPVRDPLPLQRYMDKWDGEPFIKDLELTIEKSVLEIGVGTGRLAVKVCAKCKKYTGIDLSDKSIIRAEENLIEYKNKRLICADFMSYTFDEKYDVIYSSLTFMHIAEKEKAIQKIADLLKDSGRFVLSIEKTESNLIDYGSRKIHTYPDRPERIDEYIKNANLKKVKQYETEYAVIFVADKV